MHRLFLVLLLASSTAFSADPIPVDQLQETITVKASELDSVPRLLVRPHVFYPNSQRVRGVREGRVTLEVRINSEGKVSVRKVVKSTHEDFTAMAKAFATNSRFSPPLKHGKAVGALFNWPLILRP